MISKNRISEIKKLAQKKFRDATGLFIVEGTKSVGDLLASSLTVRELFATEAWQRRHSALLHQYPVTTVTDAELERFSCLKSPQEVLAVAMMPQRNLSDIDHHQPILVLDAIRDPGNLGTIIRTADWFGIEQVVCSTDCVDLTNPKTIMATMGSFARVKVYEADLCHFLASPKISGTIYGTFMQGKPIQQVDFNAHDIIIIGNEGHGISPAVSQLVNEKIHIPSYAHSDTQAESLNASIASAIVLYQFCNKIFER